MINKWWQGVLLFKRYERESEMAFLQPRENCPSESNLISFKSIME